MKKLLSIILMAVIAMAFLTGCSDPVYDDLSNFLNVEMKQVNEDYVKITEEVGKWEEMEDDIALSKSLSDVLIPLVDASLENLEEIDPATQEVEELKKKYIKVMDAYKKGFEALLEGCETQDEATINAGNDAVLEGVNLLDEYNKALEELADAHGAEIEY